MTDFSFDPSASPSSAPKQSAYEPLMENSYSVVVDKLELKPTKANDGRLVSLCLKVDQEPYYGRLLWHNFNIENKSKVAQGIGQEEFAHFLAVIGQTTRVTEASFAGFRGRHLNVYVVRETGRDGVVRNRVKEFLSKAEPVSKKEDVVILDDDTLPF